MCPISSPVGLTVGIRCSLPDVAFLVGPARTVGRFKFTVHFRFSWAKNSCSLAFRLKLEATGVSMEHSEPARAHQVEPLGPGAIPGSEDIRLPCMLGLTACLNYCRSCSPCLRFGLQRLKMVVADAYLPFVTVQYCISRAYIG